MHAQRLARLNAGVILVAVMIAVVLTGISSAALLSLSSANASDSARAERDVQAEFVAQAALEIGKATLIYSRSALDTSTSWDAYLSTYAPANAANTATPYPPDPTFSYRLTVENNDDGGGPTDDLDGILVVTAAAYGPNGRSAAYRVLLRQPSFADYQWAMNQPVGAHFLYDAKETYAGKFHHNGSITFDVAQPITFEKFASATGVSPASRWAPYGVTTSPDAPTFQAGKDLDAAPIAFDGPGQSISELRTIAQDSGVYFSYSGKHRLLQFYDDGTVALREQQVLQIAGDVTVYHYGGPMTGWVGFDTGSQFVVFWHEAVGVPAAAPRADLSGTTTTGIPYTAMIGEEISTDAGGALHYVNGQWVSGYQTVQVWDQSQVDLIFIDGDLRLMGTVTDAVTVVASGDVYFIGDVQYQDLKQDVLGVIAGDDVFFETRTWMGAFGEDGLTTTSTNYIHAAIFAGGQRLVTQAPMDPNQRRLVTLGSMANGMLDASPLEGNAWQGGIMRQYDPWLAQKNPPYFFAVNEQPGTIVAGSFHRVRDVPAFPTTAPAPDPTPTPTPTKTTPTLN